MVNKFELRSIEIILIFLIAILTLIVQPPIPLLAIPFMIIITMRGICAILEDTSDS